MIEEQVRDFYGKLRFPGTYTLNDLEYFDLFQDNKFLAPYINIARNSKHVLDIGCGTGFITNLLARKFNHLEIDAVDFCDSIDVAISFSKTQGMTNVRYFKQNFFDFHTDKTYDLIISNGVIHHMPEYKRAIEKIKSYKAKHLVLGVYNKYGKMFKKISPVNYRNEMLYKDQEEVPFEVSFTHDEFVNMFRDHKLISPHIMVDIKNLFNRKNGGLTVYTFAKPD